MISARKARTLSDNHELLTKLEQKIIESAQQGERMVVVGLWDWESDAILPELRDKGYIVKKRETCLIRGTKYHISW